MIRCEDCGAPAVYVFRVEEGYYWDGTEIPQDNHCLCQECFDSFQSDLRTGTTVNLTEEERIIYETHEA